jgi:hypothetical protein
VLSYVLDHAEKLIVRFGSKADIRTAIAMSALPPKADTRGNYFLGVNSLPTRANSPGALW